MVGTKEWWMRNAQIKCCVCTVHIRVGTCNLILDTTNRWNTVSERKREEWYERKMEAECKIQVVHVGT